MNTLFFTLMLVAMLLTLLCLAAGIVIMGRGGDLDKKYGQKLMRGRVILQGVAVGFFVLTILTSY